MEQEEVLHEQKEELVLKIDQQTAIREKLLRDPRVHEAYNKTVAGGSLEEWIRSDTDKVKLQAVAFVENHRKMLRESIDCKLRLLRRQYELQNQ
jgi:hypothetical protein